MNKKVRSQNERVILIANTRGKFGDDFFILSKKSHDLVHLLN